jgi:1-aminocyclopropane-1-carboxylate deaminase/D-cysteine desulfhydrase-like pyridoxal-dependent ACC family enzyme
MFEFLLAKAVSQGADTLIGGAGVQSNYCRQLVAAGNALGLETRLVLRRIRGPRDDEIQGNLLLDLLAGARVRIIRGGEEEQKKAMEDLADRLRAEGKKPFVVRMASGEDLAPDVIGYVECFREIAEQCTGLGIEPSRIYLATYDTTQAGLELGRAILGSPVRVVGVAPGIWKSNPRDLVAKCANQAARALGVSHRFEPEDVCNTTDYVGEGYGIPTRESLAMLRLLARSEGIFLDPVYTSKAMSALFSHIRGGQIGSSDTVIFLHTGGLPALFAYVDELDKRELRSRLAVD